MIVNHILLYWLYITLTLCIAFIPGFAIATAIKNLSNTERLAVCFGFSFLTLVLLIPLFALKLDFLARLVFILIILISLFYLYLSKRELKFKLEYNSDIKFLITILAISLALKFMIQPIWQYPLAAADWYIHTLITPLQFEGGNWMPPRDRTPFFNLLIFAYYKMFGASFYSYWISQVISVVAGSMFIIPAYLIAKKFFSDRVARTSVAFMLIFPFIINNSMLTGPGPLDAYFMLLAIYFLFFREPVSRQNYFLAGLFGGLSFLTHNSNAIFIGTIIIIMLLFKRENKNKNKFKFNIRFWNNFEIHYVYFFASLFVVLIPYLFWVYSFYGTISTSKFIYYPFSVTGYDLALQGTPEEIFAVFHSTPITQIIWIRISNAIVTLTPAIIPLTPIPYQFRIYEPCFYHLFSLPGVLSAIMYIFVLIWFLKYVTRKTKTSNILVLFVILPFIFNLIMWGWITWGIIKQTPSILILIMLGINELYKITGTKIRICLTYLLFIGCIIEDFIFYYLLSKSYVKIGGIMNDVTLGVRRFIPDFQISDFVSAHFLLTGSDFLLNSITLIGIIIIATLCYFRFSRSEKLKT